MSYERRITMSITLMYPVPRQPSYPQKVVKLDDLLPAARKAAERKIGRGALGVLKPSDLVLIVYPPIQDSIVLQAIVVALKEKGIAAEILGEHELIGQSPDKFTKISAADPWVELNWREQVTRILGLVPPVLADETEVDRALKLFLDRTPKYNAVYVGSGGRPYVRYYLAEHAYKFKDSWIYTNCEHLLSRLEDFPGEVQAVLERKIVELLPRVQEVRITDPQGTDISFTVPPEEARVWGNVQLPGHLFMYPSQSISMARLLRPEFVMPGYKAFCRAEGVIAGTANHVGYFPHMRSYLKEGQIYRIEGGGTFGDKLREWIDKTKEVHYPLYPNPGNLYLTEVALGTVPKFFRRRGDLFESPGLLFANVYERQRSGVIHWGIGADEYHPEVVEYAKKNRLPNEHIGHAAHTYFNTYEVKLRDSGEWVKIIDKGHLTALDDPEVRRVAGQYGNPDDLLSEDWIPTIPGITYPGDYMREYGHDPATWIKKELDGQLPATIGVPK
jgi:hypothetical protein